MADSTLKRLEDLVEQGTELVPLGGFDFSGYNARLQNKYLEWRKNCLEILEQVGPIGFSCKNKILGDANGGFFFQASAQLILNQLKDIHEKIKASPELAASAGSAQPVTEQRPSGVTVTEAGGARVLKPPPKPAGAQTAPKATAAPGAGKRVYVVGEETEALRQQLSQFIQEIGLEEVDLNREHGKMLALDKIQHDESIKCAFFVFNSDDLTYAMFELGHFVGKIGAGRVIVLHMTDVDFPKNVPGVTVKPIVVKLEEASLSIMKELKSLGYQISL
ncbi:MAG: nucleotide-binding protein [Ignavibacteriales bacterium]|nr:nucleotide-binding protein [Ignavibacteriales bacterium]